MTTNSGSGTEPCLTSTLSPDLGDDVSEADDTAAIEAGTINATGFRYVATGMVR
jgi:hypothetical protein